MAPLKSRAGSKKRVRIIAAAIILGSFVRLVACRASQDIGMMPRALMGLRKNSAVAIRAQMELGQSTPGFTAIMARPKALTERANRVGGTKEKIEMPEAMNQSRARSFPFLRQQNLNMIVFTAVTTKIRAKMYNLKYPLALCYRHSCGI